MVMHESAWMWQGGRQQRRAVGLPAAGRAAVARVVAHVQQCKDQCQQCVQSMGMRAQRRLCDGVTRAARRRRRGSARTAAPPRESGASGGPRHSSAPSRVDERHLDPAAGMKMFNFIHKATFPVFAASGSYTPTRRPRKVEFPSEGIACVYARSKELGACLAAAMSKEARRTLSLEHVALLHRTPDAPARKSARQRR